MSTAPADIPNPYQAVRAAREALAKALRELAFRVRENAAFADGRAFYQELARAEDLEREAREHEQNPL